MLRQQSKRLSIAIATGIISLCFAGMVFGAPVASKQPVPAAGGVRDTSLMHQWETERRAIERNMTELSRVAASQLQDPSSPASQRYSELKDRLTAIELEIKAVTWGALPIDSLKAMKENFRKEKEATNDEYRATWKAYIKKAEDFLKDWNSNPKLQSLAANKGANADLIGQVELRLAELYAIEAFDVFGEEHEKWQDTNGPASLEPKIRYDKAVRMFQQVLTDYPSTEWAADALYSLAYIRSEESEQADPGTEVAVTERAEARTKFLQLLENYPVSSYRDDAIYNLGSYWFSTPPKNVPIAAQLDSAQHYFSMILENKDSKKYKDALYMLGWIAFRRPDYATAVDNFVKTIDYTYDHPDETDLSIDRFRKDAIHYLSAIFSEPTRDWSGSGVVKAIEYIGTDSVRAQRFGVALLEQIGDQMKTNLNEYDSAIVAWAGAINLLPNGERAPFLQAKIVESAVKDKKDQKLWFAEGKRMFDNYKVDSPWWAANKDYKLRKQVKPLVRDTYNQIVDYAIGISIDSTGRVTDPKLAEEAITVSTEFLKAFPADSSSYDFNYQLATLLANTPNRQEDAYREYENVITKYPYTRYKKDAAKQMLAVATDYSEAQLKERPYSKFDVDTTTSLPVAPHDSLTKSETMLVASSDNYATLFPEDSIIAPAYLYKSGAVLYQRGYVASADSHFQRLITQYPQSTKLVEQSYQLLVQGHLILHDFSGTEEIAKQIAASNLSDSLKSYAQERRGFAIFTGASTATLSTESTTDSTVSANDKKATNEKAGDDFMRVAIEIPGYKDAELALFNASVAYRKAEKPEKEIDALTTLAKKFPQSKRTPNALYNTGLIYQTELKKPADAAKVFDQLVNDYPTGDYDVKQALINASANYNDAQDYTNAIRINQKYADLYPTDEVAVALLFKCAGLYLKLNDVASANKIYDDFAKKYPDAPEVVTAHFERAKYAEEHGDLTTARTEYNATIERHNSLVKDGKTGNAEYASKALSQIIIWDLDKFKAVKYTQLDKFAEGTTQRKDKKTMHDDLLDKIKALVALGQPEQFAALYWAGEIEEEMGSTFLDQKLTSSTKAGEEFRIRSDNIFGAIEIYVKAVNEYAASMKQFEKSIGAIDSLRTIRVAQRDPLQAWVDANTATAPAGYVDSTTALEGLKKVIKKFDDALAEARKWQQMSQEKAPELAFRTAKLKEDIFHLALALPDEETRQRGVDPRLLRAAFRGNVLVQFVYPSARNLFDDFLAAIQVARDAGFEAKWATQSRQEMKSAIDTVLYASSEVKQRWADAFDRDHNSIQEILPKGILGRDRGGRELAYIDAEMPFIIDFYGGTKSITDSMNALMGGLLEKIAKDSVGIATLQPAIDAVVTWYYTESNKAEEMYNVAKSSAAAADQKGTETSQPQYGEAKTLYESAKVTFLQNQRDMLTQVSDLLDRTKLTSTAMQSVYEKLAIIDPETYGAKVGLKLTDNWLGSDDSWIGNTVKDDNFSDPNLDVSKWHFANKTVLTGVALDSFTAANVSPISMLKTGETPKAGQSWFRKAVWITERVTSAEMRVIADQKATVYINHDMVFETPDSGDWKAPTIQDVSAQIKPGYNLIAIELTDRVGTGGNLVAALKYRTVPGNVAPVLPEPANAGTIKMIGKGVEVTAPATQQDTTTPPPAGGTTPVDTTAQQPAPIEQPKVDTTSATPPSAQPAPIEQPKVDTTSATPPSTQPAPIEQPKVDTTSATPPSTQPAPMEQPKVDTTSATPPSTPPSTQPAPMEQPKVDTTSATPPSTPPSTQPAPMEQPKVDTTSSTPPATSQPVPVEQPKVDTTSSIPPTTQPATSQPIPVEQPKVDTTSAGTPPATSQPVPTEQPKVDTTSAGTPPATSQPVPTEQPKVDTTGANTTATPPDTTKK